MIQDPRHRNLHFDSDSLQKYLHGYAEGLGRALRAIDANALEQAHHLIVGAAANDRRVYAIGNGGSASIADHLCCDLTKGTSVLGHPTISTHSLSSNVAIYSAIANDYGFEKVFSTQVEMLCSEGDVLIAVSSSGNSPNIIAAVLAANAKGVTTIGLSGFSGGILKNLAQVSVHVAVENYGIVEDAHQALMHILAQYIAIARDGVGTPQNSA